jgi:hypothetical protein
MGSSLEYASWQSVGGEVPFLICIIPWSHISDREQASRHLVTVPEPNADSRNRG